MQNFYLEIEVHVLGLGYKNTFVKVEVKGRLWLNRGNTSKQYLT